MTEHLILAKGTRNDLKWLNMAFPSNSTAAVHPREMKTSPHNFAHESFTTAEKQKQHNSSTDINMDEQNGSIIQQ